MRGAGGAAHEERAAPLVEGDAEQRRRRALAPGFDPIAVVAARPGLDAAVEARGVDRAAALADGDAGDDRTFCQFERRRRPVEARLGAARDGEGPDGAVAAAGRAHVAPERERRHAAAVVVAVERPQVLGLDGPRVRGHRRRRVGDGARHARDADAARRRAKGRDAVVVGHAPHPVARGDGDAGHAGAGRPAAPDGRRRVLELLGPGPQGGVERRHVGLGLDVRRRPQAGAGCGGARRHEGARGGREGQREIAALAHHSQQIANRPACSEETRLLEGLLT